MAFEEAENLTDDAHREEIAYGLDMLEFSAAERRNFRNAEQLLVATCMRSRGFEYDPVLEPERAEDKTPVPETPAFRVSPAFARNQGYGLAAKLSALGSEPDLAQDEAEPDPIEQARNQALFGRPAEASGADGFARVSAFDGAYEMIWDTDSCFARARQQIYGDEVAYVELQLMLKDIKREAGRTAIEAHSAQQALNDWRACMQRHGYTYDAPGAASVSLRTGFAQGRISLSQLQTLERQVATADAACSQSSGVLASVDAEFRRAAAALAEEHKGLLALASAQKQQALRHVQDVMGVDSN